jgi:hypothetical protein
MGGMVVPILFRLRDAKTVTDQVRRNCGGETAGRMTQSTRSDCKIPHQAKSALGDGFSIKRLRMLTVMIVY